MQHAQRVGEMASTAHVCPAGKGRGPACSTAPEAMRNATVAMLNACKQLKPVWKHAPALCPGCLPEEQLVQLIQHRGGTRVLQQGHDTDAHTAGELSSIPVTWMLQAHQEMVLKSAVQRAICYFASRSCSQSSLRWHSCWGGQPPSNSPIADGSRWRPGQGPHRPPASHPLSRGRRSMLVHTYSCRAVILGCCGLS